MAGVGRDAAHEQPFIERGPDDRLVVGGARGVLAERAQPVLQSLLLVGCLVALALEGREHLGGVVGAAAAGAEHRGGASVTWRVPRRSAWASRNAVTRAACMPSTLTPAPTAMTGAGAGAPAPAAATPVRLITASR